MKKYFPYLLTAFIATIMVVVGEATNQNEIIFPEILALSSGALIAKKQPWQVTPVKMLILMSLGAVAGVMIVRFVPVHLYFKIILAFIFAALLLIISKTTMIPVISACVLPVMLSTDSYIYVAAVIVLTACILLAQKLLIRLKLRQKSVYVPIKATRFDLLIWLKRLALVSVCALIPLIFNMPYLIAPPLLVAFCELSDCNSQARANLVKFVAITISAGIIGAACRLLINYYAGLPLTAAAFIAILALLIIFYKTKIVFPPAGAVLLLPMLVKTDGLWFYPLEIAVGMIVLSIFAMVCFANSNVSEKSALAQKI